MALPAPTPGRGSSSPSTPRGWSCGCGCRRVGIRSRLPARGRAAEALARGTVYANLSVNRAGVPPIVRVNESVLAAVLATIGDVAHRIDAAPPSLDGIFALKGVIEVSEADEREEDRRSRRGGHPGRLRRGARRTRGDAPARRRGAGARARLPDWTRSRRSPSARRLRRGADPEAIKARLAEQIALLLDASDRFDADRLHQEAILIASKADVREELDRLAAHVAQARAPDRDRAGRSAAGSISWRRSSTARPTPCAPSRTTSSSPTSVSSSRRWSSSSASRCRIWSEEWRTPPSRRARPSPGAA